MKLCPTSRPAPPALRRLVAKIAQLDPADRCHVWSAYRYLRRQARSQALLDAVELTAEDLAARVQAGTSYVAVVLALKAARAVTLAHLRQAGAATRVQRALFTEAFHLTRLALRAMLGLRAREPEPVLHFGRPCEQPQWRAYCDGSRRPDAAGLGIAVYEPGTTLHTEVSLASSAATALQSELDAACVCLETLLALGVKAARVHVDSLGVFRAFEGRLTMKYCVSEDFLLRLCQQFQSLEVALVPRLHNHLADRLAAAAPVLK